MAVECFAPLSGRATRTVAEASVVAVAVVVVVGSRRASGQLARLATRNSQPKPQPQTATQNRKSTKRLATRQTSDLLAPFALCCFAALHLCFLPLCHFATSDEPRYAIAVCTAPSVKPSSSMATKLNQRHRSVCSALLSLARLALLAPLATRDSLSLLQWPQLSRPLQYYHRRCYFDCWPVFWLALCSGRNFPLADSPNCPLTVH